MSASIWKEEVDKGLIEEIKKSVRYRDQRGALTQTPLVLIRKPEEEFKPESYPCISFFSKEDRFNSKRYNPKPKVNSIHGSVAEMEDSPITLDIKYQIDFWSKYQTDMNDMTRIWLGGHFRQFNLSVADSHGNSRSCNCLRKSNLIKSDLVQGEERLFHSIINYSIWVEIGSETTYNKNVAIKINLDTSNEI